MRAQTSLAAAMRDAASSQPLRQQPGRSSVWAFANGETSRRTLPASASSSQVQSRPISKRAARSSVADPRQHDLVGPPDPISNIRPVIYAQTESDRRRDGASSSREAAQQTHPYSINEFSQASSSTEQRRRGRGLGIFRIYREHVDAMTSRVEEADMRLRLAKLSTDSTTQRFWRDNNVRFSRDLESWRREKGIREDADGKLLQSPRAIEGTSSQASPAAASLPATYNEPSSESDFYATWLQANSKRNRAYNILVWRQAWEQVRLNARVNFLRSWLRLVRRLEGRS